MLILAIVGGLATHASGDDLPLESVKKDPDNQQPVPDDWRPTLRAIVGAFVRKDFRLAQPIPNVAPVSSETAKQIREYVADYGETLVELTDATWRRSVCQWMETHWDLLVDLETEEGGVSDLVLEAKVFEAPDGYRFEIEMVYVP